MLRSALPHSHKPHKTKESRVSDHPEMRGAVQKNLRLGTTRRGEHPQIEPTLYADKFEKRKNICPYYLGRKMMKTIQYLSLAEPRLSRGLHEFG